MSPAEPQTAARGTSPQAASGGAEASARKPLKATSRRPPPIIAAR